jgi:hypothetical protein
MATILSAGEKEDGDPGHPVMQAGFDIASRERRISFSLINESFQRTIFVS